MRQALQSIDEYDQILAKPDWKASVTDKKENLTIWERTTSQGLKAMKAAGVINRKPEEIFAVLQNEKCS